MAYEKSRVLEITPEEEAAIDWYQSNSAQINELMGNFISDSSRSLYEYKSQKTKDTEPYYTPQRVEKLMDCIEKLYSAMVKTSMDKESSRPYRLYRGTAAQIKNGSEHAFFSTTTSRDEALLFATSKKYYNNSMIPHLSYVYVSGDVPYYIMPTKGNENEVLLSPFLESKVRDSYGGQWSGHNINIESVDLKKIELREFPELNRDEIKNDLLKSAESIGMAINEYMRLVHERETSIHYDSKISEQIAEKSKEIGEWKKSFRNLMEARCRDIEKNIELELQLEAKREAERQAEEARILAEQKKLEEDKKRDNSVRIKSKIRDAKEGMMSQLRSSLQMQKNAKRFGIDYNSPTNNVVNTINSWGFSGDRAGENTLHRISSMMENVNSRSGSIGKELIGIEENEIKRTMAEKVMQIRLQQEMDILQAEADVVRNQTIGFWGKIFGKEKKRKEKEQELEDKIGNMRNVISDFRDYGLSSEKNYSTHDILADIEIVKRIGAISLEESQVLNGYSMYINQTYSIDQQRVARKVEQKSTGLSTGERSTVVMGMCQEKMERTTPIRGKITDVEKFCNTIARSVKSLDRDPDYSMDFDRSYR